MNYFNTILESIYTKSPLQKKKLEKTFATKENTFFEEAEVFANNYVGYLENQNIPLEYAIDAYLNMCNMFFRAQMSFIRTGKYPEDSSDKAYENVYNDQKAMKSYMIGLALSQYLWETHYKIFKFFDSFISNNKNSISSYLEIGPGHGLYLNKALDYLKEESSVTALDISPISINITKSIINYFKENRKVEYINQDMLKFDGNKKFDFIVMCEVIEHVNFPEKLLLKMGELLSENGKAFISTCVNCPAVDHVYHFKFVEEIREMLENTGFTIESELVLPVENLPMEEIIEKKITINYCALIKR